MNSTGISQFNQARIEWAIRLRYSPMPEVDMDVMRSQLNALRIGELRTVGKTWEVMMERDGELAINSDKRKADSACLEWQVGSDGSPDGDKHAAALQYFYQNLTATKALDQDSTGGVDELIYQTLSAVDFYYSAHEMLLRVDNPAAKEITAEFRHTPVWFFEARRGYLGYLKHIFDMYGQPCIAGEWLTAVNSGWMRPLSIAYIAKWSSLTDWFIFCHRYGSGFLEAITEATRDSQEWNEAQKALDILSSDGTVLHNKGVEMKFLEQSARNQLPYEPVVELVDRLYAKCYRGVDLATGSRAGVSGGRGAGGSGEGGRNAVGASVQKEESGILLVRDAKWITGVFNDRIDRAIIRYLFDEEPRAWFALLPPLDDTSSEDLQSLQTLVPMGLRVALKEVYKRFRWSVPNAQDACLMAPQAPQPGNGVSANGRNGDTDPPARPNPGTDGNSNGNGHATAPIVHTEPKPESDGKTQKAQTTESTPIAPGADPARNPGLVATVYDRRTTDRRTSNGSSNLEPLAIDQRRSQSAATASRQMPDTQVDAGAFWSRVGLAPRGADGQTLPMPSLGYAVPNETERLNSKCQMLKGSAPLQPSACSCEPSGTEDLVERRESLVARGLAKSRAAQALQREINRRRAAENASLANDGFDPNQLRGPDGRWIVQGDVGGTAPKNPAPANTVTSLVARPATAPTNAVTSQVGRPTTQNPPADMVVKLSAQVGAPQMNGPNRTATWKTYEDYAAAHPSDTSKDGPLAGFKLDPAQQAEYDAGPNGPREYYSDQVVPPALNPDYDLLRDVVQNPLAPITQRIQDVGNQVKAVVGDLAALMAGNPQVGGNILAYLKGQELPMDKALRDSAQEQKLRGETPVATVMGRISEDLATALPTVVAMDGLPALAQRTAGLLFAAKMVADAPGITQQLKEEYAKPPEQRDADKIDSLTAQLIEMAGFSIATGIGITEPGSEEPLGKNPQKSGAPPPEPPAAPKPSGEPIGLAGTPEKSPAPPPGTGVRITTPIGQLRATGQKEAHHIIQDAAVRDLPGYNTQAAPGVRLPGPSTARGTPHYGATQSQRQPGGGTYGAERQIGYNALRQGGYSDAEARHAISEADEYFNGIGVNEATPTRVPGNRY